MRQADKNRANKAYDLVAQAEKKLREIEVGNLDVRQKFLRHQALEKIKDLRWTLSDFINADKPE